MTDPFWGRAAGMIAGDAGLELTPDELRTTVLGWISKVRHAAPNQTADKTDAEVLKMFLAEVRRLLPNPEARP